MDSDQFEQLVDENNAQADAEEIQQLQSEMENVQVPGSPDTIIERCLSPYLLGETLDEALSMGLVTLETAEFVDAAAEIKEEDPPAAVTPTKTYTQLWISSCLQTSFPASLLFRWIYCNKH